MSKEWDFTAGKGKEGGKMAEGKEGVTKRKVVGNHLSFWSVISSAQLLMKPSLSCHLTVNDHQMALYYENRSIKITYIGFLIPSLLYF